MNDPRADPGRPEPRIDPEIKIPADFVPVLTPRERFVAWFRCEGDERWFTQLRWRRVLLALLALAIAGYAGAVTTAFAFVRVHRGVEGARWVDLALPWRWPHYRVARGEHYHVLAQRMVAERKFREGFMYARAGVALSPANRDGRLLLVEMEQAARRPLNVRRTFLEGLPHHFGDAVYVKPLLMFLLQQQHDSFVVALARRYLPRLPVETEAARLFALAAATASYFRGNYDQAEDLLRQIPKLPESRDGRLLGAKIEWDRGYRELALVQLRQLADERPKDGEVHRDLVAYLRQRGLSDEARRRSLVFQISQPELAWPRIELLRAYREASDLSRIARDIEALVRDFENEQPAVLALADFAANVGDVELADRLAGHGATQSWEQAPFAFLTIEARIVAGQYAAALERIRAYRNEDAESSRRHAALFDSLQAVAALGSGDVESARSFLMNFLADNNLRAENLIAVANRFVALEAGEEARQALLRAVGIDPQNQSAMTRLVELDIALNRSELASDVRQLLRMRRPSPDVLRIARHRLGSDLFVFSPEARDVEKVIEVALRRRPESARP